MTRRCITAPGVKPHQLVLPRYKYIWVFGAVEPATGESFFLEMPALDSACFQVYLDELSRARAEPDGEGVAGRAKQAARRFARRATRVGRRRGESPLRLHA